MVGYEEVRSWMLVTANHLKMSCMICKCAVEIHQSPMYICMNVQLTQEMMVLGGGSGTPRPSLTHPCQADESCQFVAESTGEFTLVRGGCSTAMPWAPSKALMNRHIMELKQDLRGAPGHLEDCHCYLHLLAARRAIYIDLLGLDQFGFSFVCACEIM